MQWNKRKLFCIDEDEQFHINGDFNSDRATRLQIAFDRCNNETIVPQNTCHSDEEISRFLRRKFIITLQNEVKVVPDQLED